VEKGLNLKPFIDFIDVANLPAPWHDRQLKDPVFIWEQLIPVCKALKVANAIRQVDFDIIERAQNSPPFSSITAYLGLVNGDYIIREGKYNGLNLAMIHAENPSYIQHIIKRAASPQVVLDVLKAFNEDRQAKFPSTRKRKA
jgi:hypothetical protein